MDIIYIARDYGYNIEEFLFELNENSQIEGDAIELLENYINNLNIREIHEYLN